LLIGGLVGRSSETETFVETWKSKINQIKGQTKNQKRPRIFFQEWDDPIITAITWVSELIEIAGGEDYFAELKHRSLAKNRIVSAEDVARVNPDAIIGSWCGKPMNRDWVLSKPEWKKVPAVQNQMVFEIPSSIILQPGPALFIDGLDNLRKIIE